MLKRASEGWAAVQRSTRRGRITADNTTSSLELPCQGDTPKPYPPFAMSYSHRFLRSAYTRQEVSFSMVLLSRAHSPNFFPTSRKRYVATDITFYSESLTYSVFQCWYPLPSVDAKWYRCHETIPDMFMSTREHKMFRYGMLFHRY